MNLEACIRVTAPKVPDNGKSRGDVICVKPAGSPWGGMERTYHAIVEWEDVFESSLGPPGSIVADLQRQIASGETLPIASTPYAEMEQIWIQSTVRVDIDQLPEPIRLMLDDKNRASDTVPLTLIRQVTTRIQ